MEERDQHDINTAEDQGEASHGFKTKEGGLSRKCFHGCHKLEVYDWLKDISSVEDYNEVIEVRFKNTRKAYFLNPNNLRLSKGEIVAVEASPGHDIGIVSFTGHLVPVKMRYNHVSLQDKDLKKVYRKAKPVDIDKWKEAMAREHYTMIKSRQIAAELKLDMKIGDVEYQGDNTKAIFYYIADDRVDFRQLIKVLADEFKIRVEMRQIGARQEAGRIGGIGSCGRELCCSSWLTNFISVTTSAARYQEVSLNPQKLAGQCGKLKCCMNYELDAYLDAQQDFPDTSVVLLTRKGKAYHQKTDVFKRLMWYMLQEDEKKSLTCMSVDTVKEVIEMNANQKFPEKLKGIEEPALSISGAVEYQNSVGLESLTRFEDKPSQQRSNQGGKKKPFRGNKKHFHKGREQNQNRPDKN